MNHTYSLRPASDSDVESLHHWRNLPHVRESMITQTEIELSDHKAWWDQQKTRDDRRIFIIERDQVPVAVVNFFDFSSERSSAWWGFYLTDAVATQGTEKIDVWLTAESLALRYAFETLQIKTLFCETREQNEPVLMLHDRFGFETLKPDAFPNAIEHSLIVKKISTGTFGRVKKEVMPQSALTADITSDPRDIPAPFATIRFMGSANWDQIAADLTNSLTKLTGKPVACRTAPFGQAFIQLNTPASNLLTETADYWIFCERLEDFLPSFTYGIDGHQDEIADRFAQYIKTIERARKNLDGVFLIHELTCLRLGPTNISEGARLASTVSKLLDQLNEHLRELCRKMDDTFFVPLSLAVQDIGMERAAPGKYWLLGRLPFGPGLSPVYSNLISGIILAHRGLTARALVLDLDNTLWGGVVGDDGMENLKLGPDYPDNQFLEFQEFIKSLRDRGLILALCSKNTESVAQKAINELPNMVLREEDFTSKRINWLPKSANIQEIAKELNLGPGSLLFIDDNPMERMEVRQNCPSVIVPELPDDVSQWIQTISNHPALFSLQTLSDDQDKVKKYEIRRQIEADRERTGDPHEFLRNLELKVEVTDVTDLTWQRAVQLIAKTNQFNTTTRRYSERSLREIIADGGHILTVRIEDKYGSNEVIAVLVLRKVSPETLHIDNFIMSCRVLGRGVETAALSAVSRLARRSEYRTISAEIIETERNGPCRSVFLDHGFEHSDATLFQRNVADGDIEWPEWITELAVAESVGK